jgi:type II secretory pathway component PulJ
MFEIELKNQSNGKRNEQGYSLIEMLLTMVLFLMGTASVFGILQLSMIQRNTVDTRTDQFRSARIAMEYIRRDALNAGYGFHRTGGNIADNGASALLGIAADADVERDVLTSIVAGNNRNTNVLSPPALRTDSVSFASRDTTFNAGRLIPFTSTVTSGTSVDLVTGLVPVTGLAENAACQLYDVYLLEATVGISQAIGVVSAVPNTTSIRFTPGDPLNLNQSATATGQAQSLLVGFVGGGNAKKVNLISYHVTNDGVLVRRRFGNQTGMGPGNQVESRELVFGVSDFQVLYYLEDGTTVDDPSVNNNGRLNQLRMNDVVQIQLTITLAASRNDISSRANAPIVLREYVSTKNLRYESS